MHIITYHYQLETELVLTAATLYKNKVITLYE